MGICVGCARMRVSYPDPIITDLYCTMAHTSNTSGNAGDDPRVTDKILKELKEKLGADKFERETQRFTERLIPEYCQRIKQYETLWGLKEL